MLIDQFMTSISPPEFGIKLQRALVTTTFLALETSLEADFALLSLYCDATGPWLYEDLFVST